MASTIKIPRKVATWRAHQKPQSIMKTSTFNRIKASAEASSLSKKRAKKVAGSAYWKTVKAKYRKRKKGGKK